MTKEKLFLSVPSCSSWMKHPIEPGSTKDTKELEGKVESACALIRVHSWLFLLIDVGEKVVGLPDVALHPG